MERLVDPLTTIDAKLWADEFMKVRARLGEQEFDHAVMLGWFANAIMQGYDEGQRRAKADAQATVEALQRERDGLEAKCLEEHVTIEQADAKVMKLEGDKGMWANERRDVLTQLENAESQLSQLQALVRALQRELLEWKRALCNLTPGGSEFADDHAYCAEWVRKVRENQHDIIISKHRELKATQAALDAEREKVKDMEEWLAAYKQSAELARKDVNTLNQLLRDKGLGQGEIDAMAAEQDELSALQGLVRAISETMEPFRLSLAKLDEVDTLATRRIAEADAYYCAQRVLSTLPATPTERGEG